MPVTLFLKAVIYAALILVIARLLHPLAGRVLPYMEALAHLVNMSAGGLWPSMTLLRSVWLYRRCGDE